MNLFDDVALVAGGGLRYFPCMWVYKDESLRRRFALPEEIGFWVDYWLFLHSMDTPPTWNVRPLGLRGIASEALKCRGREDSVLRKQLAEEVINSAGLIPFLSHIPVSPSGPPIEKWEWKKNWIRWFEAVVKQYDPAAIISDLAQAVASALASRNWYQAAFLIRRLAGELGQHDWSRAHLLGVAKRNFCDDSAPDGKNFDAGKLQQAISATFIRSERVTHLVHIPLAPAVVTQVVLKRFKHRKLFADRGPTGEQVLRAVEISVEAVHSEEAAAIARTSVRELIERLRLTYYIRTGVAGDAAVTRSDTGATFNAALPQPFWSSAQFFRRNIPRLPKDDPWLLSQLPDDECSRWRAAQWHLSQAIATWGEDSHTAASEVWQALEAFAGVRENGWRGVLDFVSPYGPLSVIEMAEHVANGVTLQAREFKLLKQDCDWYRWNAKWSPVDSWFKNVVHRYSPNCYQNWVAPPVPPFLSDGNIGILGLIFQRLRGGTRSSWVEKRLISDLRLLYALRNKVVHRGERIFGERAATYLGQVGIEMLFGVMRLRRDSVMKAGAKP